MWWTKGRSKEWAPKYLILLELWGRVGFLGDPSRAHIHTKFDVELSGTVMIKRAEENQLAWIHFEEVANAAILPTSACVVLTNLDTEAQQLEEDHEREYTERKARFERQVTAPRALKSYHK